MWVCASHAEAHPASLQRDFTHWLPLLIYCCSVFLSRHKILFSGLKCGVWTAAFVSQCCENLTVSAFWMSLLNVNMFGVCRKHQLKDNTYSRPLEWLEKLIICQRGQQALLCFTLTAHKNLHKLHICWLLSCCKCVGVCLQSVSAIQTEQKKIWNSLLTNFGRSNKTRNGKKWFYVAQNRTRSPSREFLVEFLKLLWVKSRPVSLLIYPNALNMHTHILLHNKALEQQLYKPLKMELKQLNIIL